MPVAAAIVLMVSTLVGYDTAFWRHEEKKRKMEEAKDVAREEQCDEGVADVGR